LKLATQAAAKKVPAMQETSCCIWSAAAAVRTALKRLLTGTLSKKKAENAAGAAFF
jgi:hypothetical protein